MRVERGPVFVGFEEALSVERVALRVPLLKGFALMLELDVNCQGSAGAIAPEEGRV